MTMYIGIDIGGTSIKCGLVDAHGHISRKVTRPTATAKVDIMADLVAMIQGLQADGQVAGIGVSMPGVVQSDGFLTTAGAVTAFEKLTCKLSYMHRRSYRSLLKMMPTQRLLLSNGWE